MTQYIIIYAKHTHKEPIEKILLANKLAFISYDVSNKFTVPLAMNPGKVERLNAALLTVKAMVPLVIIKKIG